MKDGTASAPGDHDIEQLMRQFQASDLNDIYVRAGGVELFLSRDASAEAPWHGPGKREPVVRPPTASPASVGIDAPPIAAAIDIPDGFALVAAPYLGTFYRAPRPGEPVFVALGDTVGEGQELCLIEVMKLFTAVRAAAAGVVRHIYATDGQMVAEGQPLFAIEPG